VIIVTYDDEWWWWSFCPALQALKLGLLSGRYIWLLVMLVRPSLLCSLSHINACTQSYKLVAVQSYVILLRNISISPPDQTHGKCTQYMWGRQRQPCLIYWCYFVGRSSGREVQSIGCACSGTKWFFFTYLTRCFRLDRSRSCSKVKVLG